MLKVPNLAQDVSDLVDRLQADLTPITNPQQILDDLRAQGSRLNRINGWLADHIVALLGTMFTAYLFALLALISLPATVHSHDTILMVAWVSQAFLQLVLLPVILVASNRSAERDWIKNETDRRAQAHLYEVNEQQLALLRKLEAELLNTAKEETDGS